MNRNGVLRPAPQHGRLFRLISWVSRAQLSGLLSRHGNPHVMVALFAMLTGAVALGTITVAALATDLPLLFPPLGPSAFIIFFTPMAAAASPRNVVMAHTLAVLSGLFALLLVGLALPDAGLTDPAVLNWPRVLAIALAMGLITVLMAALGCAHPPAAATALIAAMGYLVEPAQAAGLCGAAILLVIEGVLLNRLVGGLPYPVWRADPEVARRYAALAGLPAEQGGYWRQMTVRILQGRRGP